MNPGVDFNLSDDHLSFIRTMPYRPKQGTKRPRPAKATYYRPAKRQKKIYSPRYQELKFFDSEHTVSPVPLAGQTISSINIVPQGTSESERIGRKIWVRRIEANFSCTLAQQQDTDDIGNGDVLRIIIFLDQQTNGSSATVLEIMQQNQFDAHFNINNKERFKILWDKTVTMNRRVSGTDGPNRQSTPLVIRYVNYNRNMYGKGISVDFDSSTGAVSEMRTNNIGFLYITSFGIVGITSQKTRIFYDG